MIVLDTHVAVWMLIDPNQLSGTARQIIREELERGEKVGCSAVSLYEIANAVRRERLKLKYPVAKFLAALRTRLTVISLTPEIAIAAARLESPMHGDPMDRLIAATAVIENCALVTADRRLQAAGSCRTIW